MCYDFTYTSNDEAWPFYCPKCKDNVNEFHAQTCYYFRKVLKEKYAS